MKKAFEIIRKLLQHELISGSIYVFLGTVVVNLLGFLVNFFLVRRLGPQNYGIYASLLSLITLATIPAQSLTSIIVLFATKYFAQDNTAKAATFYKKAFLFIFVFSLALFLSFVAFSVPIKNFLKLDSNNYILLVGVIVACSYLSIINNAFLQSLLKFKLVSTLSSIAGGLRLVGTIILVAIGFKVFGALWGFILGFFVSFLLAFIPLRFLFRSANDAKIKLSSKEIFTYAIPASITIIFLSSFISTDVILVKHFFSGHDAGLYGGISLIGRVIFYFSSSIPIVMFPLLVKRHTRGQQFHTLFYLSLLLVSIPSFMISIFYFIFPNIVINIFLGEAYRGIAGYIGIFSLYIVLYSIVNIFVNFFLSIHKTKIAYIVFPFAFVQILLITFFHTGITQIILDSIFALILLLVGLCIYYYFLFVKK